MILLHTTVPAVASVVLACALVGCGRKETPDTSGHLLVHESNEAGITGHFDSPLDKHVLQGPSQHGDRVKPFPVSPHRRHRPPSGPVDVVEEHISFDKPAPHPVPSGERDCSAYISSVRVVGLPSAEVQRKLNELLSPNDASGPEAPCNEGYRDVVVSEVTWNRNDVLSVQYVRGFVLVWPTDAWFLITDLVLDVRTGDRVELSSCLPGGEARLRELLEARIAEEPEKDDAPVERVMEAVRTRPLPPFVLRADGVEFDFPLIHGLNWPLHPYTVSWAELRPLFGAQCLLAPLATDPVRLDGGVSAGGPRASGKLRPGLRARSEHVTRTSAATPARWW
jgi:hypothetical protein